MTGRSRNGFNHCRATINNSNDERWCQRSICGQRGKHEERAGSDSGCHLGGELYTFRAVCATLLPGSWLHTSTPSSCNRRIKRAILESTSSRSIKPLVLRFRHSHGKHSWLRAVGDLRVQSVCWGSAEVEGTMVARGRVSKILRVNIKPGIQTAG